LLKKSVFTGKIDYLQIAFDRTEGRVEISATASEAFKHEDLLARVGPGVVPRDIARTGFEC